MNRFGVEMRSEIQGKKLHGHAAVFGQYADLGKHLEALDQRAFDAALKSPDTDVRALWNHSPDHLLGRQSSGTLKLGTDSEGLEFELDLPNTTAGNDVRELAERGDITGASFAFVPGEHTWGVVQGRRLQTHTSVARLVDISPVAFPAYGGAAVAMRSAVTPATGNRQRSQLVLARHRILKDTNHG